MYPKRSATAATSMTVVRCSQPTRDGDRDDAGLKKSSDGRRVDLAGNPGPGLHFAADPVHIASGVVVRSVVVVEVVEVAVLLPLPPLLPVRLSSRCRH